jgi:hypothetical protein
MHMYRIVAVVLCIISLTISASYAQTISGAGAEDRTQVKSEPGTKTSDQPLTDREKQLLDRIEALERRLAALEGQQPTGLTPVSANVSAIEPAPVVSPAKDPGVATQTQAADTQAAKAPGAPVLPSKAAPFSDADWTWLNGNPRTTYSPGDTKFFTPDIRADITYAYSFNKPQDDSIGGSSEMFRSNEIQLEQLGVGGDFHWEDVRARFMTQFGLYSTATPRNDASPAKGQWQLNDANRYLSEAYGGYHLNVLDGINLDAGIFMSYVGLFSYYNFDNWAYQPSYVSSNTPWFFQGIRIQIFPNPHLKIEPWIINGWQSYGSANYRKGLGGQLKYTPFSWMNIISNEYGLGHDDLYVPNRARLHTDNSIEIKYYDNPHKTIDKMAFTFTGDLGCEYGNGVSCYTDKTNAKYGFSPKQSFIGFMLYDRTWFHKDLFGLTIGGGRINNPGRYLVLVPPINGATAASAALNSPYFTFNPGNPFKAWDTSVTLDYMPRQWLTFRTEYVFRHANVPYFSGAGGITPPPALGVSPGTNNGFPTQFSCFSGVPVPATSFAGGVTNTGYNATFASAYCSNPANGPNGGLWMPDLRKSENLIDIDLLVKF